MQCKQPLLQLIVVSREPLRLSQETSPPFLCQDKVFRGSAQNFPKNMLIARLVRRNGYVYKLEWTVELRLT